jgi:superfamily II DNA or RNA helicase
MHQMARAVREMGEDVGVFGDGEWRYVDGFNVGMVQTFMAAMREPGPGASDAVWAAKLREIEKVKEILARFELVIAEEAHEASGNGYFELMSACVNAHYRLSLTATPFMKEDEEANMRLMASSGPVAIKVSEETLIERGILARPYFMFVKMADPMPEGILERRDMEGRKTGDDMVTRLTRSMPWTKCYEVGVVGGIKRNGIVVYHAKRAAAWGLSVLVLVQHKRHGQLLQRLLTEAGVRCNFIFGDHNQKERDAAISALKTGRIDVLIGSTILDVGVDVPAIGMIIIASGGKAEVAMRQRIGRGLREKKGGAPNVAFIIDFDDWQNNHLKDHSRQRRAIIEGTPGFREGILAEGMDFDFAAAGLMKRAA